jgi:hypothetical protein
MTPRAGKSFHILTFFGGDAILNRQETTPRMNRKGRKGRKDRKRFRASPFLLFSCVIRVIRFNP